MAAQVYVAPLFFSLPDLRDFRKRRDEWRHLSSSQLWGVHQSRPRLGNQKASKVDADLRYGLESVEINLLSSRGGRVYAPRYPGCVVANNLYLILGLEKFGG